MRLGVTGQFDEDDLGVKCYHSKVGAAELLLNHLVDVEGEYVVMDMTAGADAFASGLFTRFDVTFLVCEPTVRSVGVYRQYADYARDFGVRLVVVGNKVTDAEDVEFLQEQVGDALLGWMSASGTSARRSAARPGRSPSSSRATSRRCARCRRRWTRSSATGRATSVKRSSSTCATRTPGRAPTWRPQVDPEFVLGPRLPV